MRNRAVAAGYLAQVERANESPEALKRRLEEANTLIESLRSRVKQLSEQVERQRVTIASNHRLPDGEPDVQKVLQVAGRAVGNQAALARSMPAPADRISKWHKEGRLQCYTDASGIEWFYLDQARPSRKKRGSL